MTWKVPFGQGDTPRVWPKAPAEPLGRYAANDAAITMRLWAEYAALDAERARRRWHRILAALAFAALAVAMIVEASR